MFADATNPANREKIRHCWELLGDEESKRIFLSKLKFYTGFDKTLIRDIYTSQTIYFEKGVVHLRPDEVYVDGGAYSGDTLQQFLKESGGHFKKYYAFEPDPGSYAKLEEIASLDPERIIPQRCGIYGHSGALQFICLSAVDSRIAAPGEKRRH